jgi:hypothetical protein
MAQKLFTHAKVTVAASAVQVDSTATPITSIMFQADLSNTGNIYIGDSNVGADDLELIPGDVQWITSDNRARGGSEEFLLSDFYIHGGTTGDTVKVSYIKQR